MSIEHGEQILYLQQTVADIMKDVEVRFNNVRLEQAGVVDMMTEKIRAMSDEIAILRRAELRRQGVKDISSAMAAAEGLVDFHLGGSTSSASDKGKSVEGKFGKNKDWKKKAADGRKEKEVEAKGKKPMQSKNSGCFICSGPHRARDCPMKKRVSALVSQEVETSDSDVNVVRANCIQLLNIIRVVKQPLYDLMQVQVQVNGKYVQALLDTGADSNYLAQHMVDRLGLTLSKCSKRVKAVNLGAVAVLGETEIEVGLGTWHGQCMMNVIPLVDFETVLGIEFFVKAKKDTLIKLLGLAVSGIKKGRSKLYSQALQLVKCIWKEVMLLCDDSQISDLTRSPRQLIFAAAEIGNAEFLSILINDYPSLIWQRNHRRHSIFHIAVLHRQNDIFKLVSELGSVKDLIIASKDCDRNNILHLAGRLGPRDKLDAPGAALQMQRELLWFKAVEIVTHPGTLKLQIVKDTRLGIYSLGTIPS
ncbi:hypothetical protein JRO89_XS06G0237200 [Xanthoceras sorbifolium]|uniref:Peptidase A2 domain-containing protein n=1 Tax=Xanthoceras sorbifolium TaxID=99658 RepID=A0ABQ8HZ98_9ROSI|nr:hypothetical protein JRO89_XS06G0237200 [Xanthoceras sorbifolium]